MTSTSTSKGSYISFNSDEQERLGGADFEEIALYFFLKQKSNFRTGAFGSFKNLRFTYGDLCAALHRPAGPNHPERDFDVAHVVSLLVALEGMGLVANRAVTEERLTMELPISRKWPQRKSPLPESAATDQSVTATPNITEAADLRDSLPADFFDSPSAKDGSSPLSPSVMINTDSTESSLLKTSTDPTEEKSEALTLEALWQESEAQAQKPQAPTIHPQIIDDAPLADEVEDIDDIVLPDETDDEIETAASDSPTRWIDDDNIDTPDFDQWVEMFSARMFGSYPESECAEHHAPRNSE
ncbi:MAG: hypothetical protein WCJ66_15395 [Verrucomicrobiota bacterium]